MGNRPANLTRARGASALALVLSLSVLLGLAALAIDRACVSLAAAELQRAADAAALAACRQLASDELLRPRPEVADRIRAATAAAGRFARWNPAAGRPTGFSDDASDPAGADIDFGRFDHRAGRFVSFAFQTDRVPSAVRVTVRRTQRRHNPVGMLLGRLLGVTSADVVAEAQAALEDRVVGFAPVDETPAPVLPLAICRDDIDGTSGQTWQMAIVERQGDDLFGIDPRSGKVVRRSDRIPEIELSAGVGTGRASGRWQQPTPANVAWVELSKKRGRGAGDGLSRQDLEPWGGELLLEPDHGITVSGSALLPAGLVSELSRLRGQPMVWLLYDAGSSNRPGRLRLTGFVGARIMEVRRTGNGLVRLRVQPCIVVTRSALTRPDDPSVPRHPYVRKLVLTG